MAKVMEWLYGLGVEVDKQKMSQAKSSITELKNFAKRALGVIGLGISLSQLNAIAEEFNGINDKINYAAQGAEDLKAVQKDILESANRCKQSYGQMADSVVSLKQANGDLFPIDEATEFVEYVNKLGLAAGYSSGEISSMQNTMQRAVAFGKLSTMQINRMAMTTPALLEHLCNSLGVTRDQLNALADEGKITAEVLKKSILNSKETIDRQFDGLDYSISDALLNIRNQWGFFVDDVNSSLHITQTIAKTLVSAFSTVMGWLNKAKDALMRFADRLGGTERLLKLVAIAAGAVMVALNWSKIIGVLKTVFSLINMGNIKMLAGMAVIILIALLIEDFINFLQGNNSVIGLFFDKIGIGSDTARQAVLDAFGKIKDFITETWAGIQRVFAEHIGPILEKLNTIWDNISQIGMVILNDLAKLFKAVFGGGEEESEDSGNAIVDALDLVLDGVDGLLKILADFTTWLTENPERIEAAARVVEGLAIAFGAAKLAGLLLNGALFLMNHPIALVAIAIAGLLAIGGWLAKHWEELKLLAQLVWEIIKEKVSTVISSIRKTIANGINFISSLWTTVWQTIGDFFNTIWENIKTWATEAWDTITETFSGAKETVIGWFTGIGSGITAAVGNAAAWATAAWASIKLSLMNRAEGIKSWFQGLGSKISTAVGDAAEWASGAWDDIKTAISGKKDEIAGWFTGVGDAISEQAGNAGRWATNAWLKIRGQLKQRKDEIAGWFTGVAGKVSTAAGNVGEWATNAWTTITGALENKGETIAGWFSGLTDAANDGPAALAEYMAGTFTEAFENVKTFLSGTAFGQAITNVGAKFRGIWTKDLAPIVTWIDDTFGPVWEGLQTTLSGLIDFINDVFSGDWEGAWDGLVTGLGTIFGKIKGLLLKPINAVIDVINTMIGAVEGMINAVINGINGALTIKLDPIDVFGATVFPGLDWSPGIETVKWDRIQHVGEETEAAMAEGGILSEGSAIVAEAGPERLSMVGGKAVVQPLPGSKGYKGNQEGVNMIAGLIRTYMSDLMVTLHAMANANMVSAATMGAAYGNVNNSRNISQNVNINNTFNGDRAIQQNAEKAMNNAAVDVTQELARGLAYAR